MTLDLEALYDSWTEVRVPEPERPEAAPAARILHGRDGREMIQLKVDLGVLQMTLDGPPDGSDPDENNTPFVHAQLAVDDGAPLEESDWSALQRELHQHNFRRLALSMLALHAIEEQTADAPDLSRAALRDTNHCLAILKLTEDVRGHAGADAGLIPSLVFTRASLRARIRVLENRIEDAIYEIQQGIAQLQDVLERSGFDDELRINDPGVRELERLQMVLRREHGVSKTLREKLADAIENEDFEAAARLRDELRQKEGGSA